MHLLRSFVVDLVVECLLQPFRTTPLVSPTPKTINEVVHSTRSRPVNRQDMVSPPTYGSQQQPQVKTVNFGGSQKQIVSSQFNSPINMYSDESIADSAVANQSLMQAK